MENRVLRLAWGLVQVLMEHWQQVWAVEELAMAPLVQRRVSALALLVELLTEKLVEMDEMVGSLARSLVAAVELLVLRLVLELLLLEEVVVHRRQQEKSLAVELLVLRLA